MYKDPTEFRERFAAWKDGKQPYKGGRPSAISEVDKSDADFAERLRSNWRQETWDWEGSGKAVTHKIGSADNIVYPNVQTTKGGGLIDFTNPIWKGVVDPLNRAMINKDYVPMKTEQDAIWFGPNYKEYYPKFKDGKLPGYKNGLDDTIDFLKQYEGFKDTTYLDGNGIPTIGYGFTDSSLVKKGKISREEADIQLRKEVLKRESNLQKLKHWDKLNENSKTALRSYYYNYPAGFKDTTKFMKYWNAGDFQNAIREVDAGMNDKKKHPLQKERVFCCKDQSYSFLSSATQSAQMFLFLMRFMSLVPPQKMHAGVYFFRMMHSSSTKISSGSLISISSVRLSSIGSTILPSSSTFLTIPVAFIASPSFILRLHRPLQWFPSFLSPEYLLRLLSV